VEAWIPVQQNVTAIVLRSRPYGESHTTLQLLTEAGSLSAMARGAKKPQSRLRAATGLCAKAVFTIRRGSGMATVLQAEVLDSHRGIHESLDKAAYAAYFCDLAGAAAAPYPEAGRDAFVLLDALLTRLDAGSETEVGGLGALARFLEIKTLRLVGANPSYEFCGECGSSLLEQPSLRYVVSRGAFFCSTCVAKLLLPRSIEVPAKAMQVLYAMDKVPYTQLGQLRLSPVTVRLLRQVLRLQLSEYAGISPKSGKVLEEILWSLGELDCTPVDSSVHTPSGEKGEGR
jgi:DNA repair protein RecO (recombination protein O)